MRETKKSAKPSANGNGVPHRRKTKEQRELARRKASSKKAKATTEGIAALRRIRETGVHKSEKAIPASTITWKCDGRERGSGRARKSTGCGRMELLASNGKKSYRFTAGAIQPAASLLGEPEEFLWVYEQAAKQCEPVTEEAVRQAVKANNNFVSHRIQWVNYQEEKSIPEGRRVR